MSAVGYESSFPSWFPCSDRALFQNKASYVKNLRAFFHHLTTKPPALVFSEARRLSWPKLLIFTPFDTAMFALPDRPYFRIRPFMIRI